MNIHTNQALVSARRQINAARAVMELDRLQRHMQEIVDLPVCAAPVRAIAAAVLHIIEDENLL